MSPGLRGGGPSLDEGFPLEFGSRLNSMKDRSKPENASPVFERGEQTLNLGMRGDLNRDLDARLYRVIRTHTPNPLVKSTQSQTLNPQTLSHKS
jgi:hypothetical protein